MELDNNIIEQAPTMDISSPALAPSGDNFTTDNSVQTTVEEGKKSNLLLKVALVGTSALVYLSSCNQTPAIVQPPMEAVPTQIVDSTLTIDNTPEKENIAPEVEITAMPTIIEDDNNTVTIEDNTIIEMEEDNTIPEKEFDSTVLNMTEWNSYNLIEKEILENPESITLLEGTKLYSFPVLDIAFDDYPMVTEITLGYPLDLQISEKRQVSNDKGEMVEVGLVSNSYSRSPYGGALVAIIGATDSSGVEEVFYEETESPSDEKSVVSTQIFDLFRENDFQSTLLTIERFMKYQEENGGFVPGVKYNIKDMLTPLGDFYDLASNPGLQGRILTTGWQDFCSGISLFLNKNGNIGEVTNFTLAEGKYSGNPFELENRWETRLTFNNPNFEFEVYEPGYFKIDIVVLPKGPEAEIINTPAGISEPATRDIIYTLTYVLSNDVATQSEIFVQNPEKNTLELTNPKNAISVRHYYNESRTQTEMMKSIFNTIKVSDYE